jgi:hypothetical protein
MAHTTSALYMQPTASSRQRTISSSTSGPTTPQPPSRRLRKQSSSTNVVARASARASSPAFSAASTGSGMKLAEPRTPKPRITNGIPSRPSIEHFHTHTPRRSVSAAKVIDRVREKTASPRTKRPYVANPKNRLDVAIGDVVNKLSADVPIKAEDSWKDESGKYWIGDTEPRLCFCRILRSQTVMVRVGGGWMELSKCVQGIRIPYVTILNLHFRFIRIHFAHIFRIDNLMTPSRSSTRAEEHWISSATRKEAAQESAKSSLESTPSAPIIRTPIISSAGGSLDNRSPSSLLRERSPGPSSPLAPLQFMRRAAGIPPISNNIGTPIRDRSPGARSSDGTSNSAQPRIATSTSGKLLPPPGTPNRPPPWR